MTWNESSFLTCIISSRQLKMYFLASFDLMPISASCSAGVCGKKNRGETSAYVLLTHLWYNLSHGFVCHSLWASRGGSSSRGLCWKSGWFWFLRSAGTRLGGPASGRCNGSERRKQNGGKRKSGDKCKNNVTYISARYHPRAGCVRLWMSSQRFMWKTEVQSGHCFS